MFFWLSTWTAKITWHMHNILRIGFLLQPRPRCVAADSQSRSFSLAALLTAELERGRLLPIP